jgi:hypothetical protein
MANQILIISHDENGEIYTYFETPEHFAVVTHRGDKGGRDMSKWVSPDLFDNECLTKRALRPGEWTSILVK